VKNPSKSIKKNVTHCVQLKITCWYKYNHWRLLQIKCFYFHFAPTRNSWYRTLHLWQQFRSPFSHRFSIILGYEAKPAHNLLPTICFLALTVVCACKGDLAMSAGLCVCVCACWKRNFWLQHSFRFCSYARRTEVRLFLPFRWRHLFSRCQ